MHSNSTSASTKGLFRFKLNSNSSTTLSSPKRSVISRSEPSSTKEISDQAVNDPVQKVQDATKPADDDPTTSNTINSLLNFHELYKLRRSICYCFCIAMAGFVFGFDIGIIGGLVNFTSFQQKFGDSDGNTFNRITLGIIVGASSLSSCVSGLASNYLTDEYGRKSAIIAAMFLYGGGLLIFVSSKTWYQIVLGRVFNGFGLGISSVAAPMLISELPQPKLRGSMVTSMQLMTTMGIFMGSITLFLTKNLEGEFQYSGPIYVSLGFVICTMIALIPVPESPIFLVQKELHENAAEIIADINNLKRDHWYVSDWIDSLIKSFEKRKQQDDFGIKNKRKSMTRAQPKILRRAMLGIMMMAFQQLTGINYFFFYGTTIFEKAGIEDPYITAIILASVNWATSLVSIFISDMYGRRNMLIFGGLSMFICMMVFASVGSFALGSFVYSGYIMIAVTCTFIASFSLSWGPIAFMVVSELFPYKYKAKGMALASSANWITTFLISFWTPFITEVIGFKYGFFFALCLLSSLVFVWGLVPETRKRDSDHIDAIYADGNTTFWKGTSQYEREIRVVEDTQDTGYEMMETPSAGENNPFN